VMSNQIAMFRKYALSDFRTLLLQVSMDPAMIFWLDNHNNTKRVHNENYGRELLELFSMGIGNYTEEDVKNCARAFTGWTLRNTIPALQLATIGVQPSRGDHRLACSTQEVLAVVGELLSLVVVEVDDVDRVDCVASRAARPKPAVAATAVTARPVVTATVRRLPCSRDVIAPPRMASTEHRGGRCEVAVRAAGACCGSRLAEPQQTRSDCPHGLQPPGASSGHGH